MSQEDDTAIYMRCQKRRMKVCGVLRASALRAVLATVDESDTSKDSDQRLRAKIALRYQRLYRSAANSERDPTLRRNDLEALRKLRTAINDAFKDPNNRKPVRISRESASSRQEKSNQQDSATGTSTQGGSRPAATTLSTISALPPEKHAAQGFSSRGQTNPSTTNEVTAGEKLSSKRKRSLDVDSAASKENHPSGASKTTAGAPSSHQVPNGPAKGKSAAESSNQAKKQKISKQSSTSQLANASAATWQMAAGSVDDSPPQRPATTKPTAAPTGLEPPPYERRSALAAQNSHDKSSSSSSDNNRIQSTSSASSNDQHRRRLLGHGHITVQAASSSTIRHEVNRTSAQPLAVPRRPEAGSHARDTQPSAYQSHYRANLARTSSSHSGADQLAGPQVSDQRRPSLQQIESATAENGATGQIRRVPASSSADQATNSIGNAQKTNQKDPDDMSISEDEDEDKNSRANNSNRESDNSKPSSRPELPSEIAMQEKAAKATPPDCWMPPETKLVTNVKENWQKFCGEKLMKEKGCTRFSTVRAERPILKAVFDRETPLNNLRLGASRLFRRWEPFWQVQKEIITGVTVKIKESEWLEGKLKPTNNFLNAPKTVAAFKLSMVNIKPFASYLQFKKKVIGAANNKDGDFVLMLRMLPIKKDPKYKRAPCHLWPKGTFLTINGTPRELIQRKQANHDPAKWEGNCIPLDLSSIMESASQDITIAMCCQDDKQFAFSVSICFYKTPAKLQKELLSVTNPFFETLSPEQSMKKAMIFMKKNSMITIDDDDGASGEKREMARLVFSLMDPVTKTPIKIPVRGRDCKHWQCFDLETRLLLNEKVAAGRWRCPCCESFVSCEDLQLCGLTQVAVNQWKDTLSYSRNTVELREDKSYTLLPAARMKNQQRSRGSKAATARSTTTQSNHIDQKPPQPQETIELIDSD
mmetsp:Transcript_99005/g.285706  ORF Transcript_99005/g.285706 Transcript_99005/m.285706 type:complete len:932 (+) Transcript_99005:186-2981(+)